MLALSGCSINQIAVNKIGDALATGGDSWSSDNDPELIKAASPFSLKLMESLLADNPRHEGLLLAAAKGFTQYSYAFVQFPAEQLEDTDFDQAQHEKKRACNLYLRARDYGMRGLEVRHPGFGAALRAHAAQAVSKLTRDDVPFIYWTAVSWAGAISLSIDSPERIGEIPLMEALIDRALTLDETFDNGAIHSFLVTYSMSRQGLAHPEAEARRHFERAVELSGGQMAAPYVALAESVALANQNRKEFEQLLQKALAIDPNKKPEWRLNNLIYQQRARWLLSRVDRLFL